MALNWKLPRIMSALVLMFCCITQVSALAGSELIEIDDNACTPETITINPGVKVTWANDGEQEHQIKSDDGLFAPRSIAPDGHFMTVFHNPGTYTYSCYTGGREFKGKVIVQERAAS